MWSNENAEYDKVSADFNGSSLTYARADVNQISFPVTYPTCRATFTLPAVKSSSDSSAFSLRVKVALQTVYLLLEQSGSKHTAHITSSTPILLQKQVQCLSFNSCAE